MKIYDIKYVAVFAGMCQFAAGNSRDVIGRKNHFIKKHKMGIARRKISYAELDQSHLTSGQKEGILRFVVSDTGYVR